MVAAAIIVGVICIVALGWSIGRRLSETRTALEDFNPDRAEHEAAQHLRPHEPHVEQIAPVSEAEPLRDALRRTKPASRRNE